MAIWESKRTNAVIVGNSQSLLKAKIALNNGNLFLLIDNGKESLNPNIYFLVRNSTRKFTLFQLFWQKIFLLK